MAIDNIGYYSQSIVISGDNKQISKEIKRIRSFIDKGFAKPFKIKVVLSKQQKELRNSRTLINNILSKKPFMIKAVFSKQQKDLTYSRVNIQKVLDKKPFKIKTVIDNEGVGPKINNSNRSMLSREDREANIKGNDRGRFLYNTISRQMMIGNFKKGLKNSFKPMNKEMLSSAFNNLTSTESLITGYLAKDFLNKIIGDTKELGLAKKNLEIFFGKDFGNITFERLKNLALTTPYSVSELTTQVGQLKASTPINNKEIVNTMMMMASVARGNKEVFDRAIVNLGQVLNLDKLYQRDAKQFLMMGIPLWEYLSKATGLTVKEVQSKMLGKGNKGISGKMVMKAFELMTSEGGKFYNVLSSMTDTLYGQFERLNDATKQFNASLGSVIAMPLKGWITGISKSLLVFSNAPDWIKKTTVALTALLALSPLIAIFAKSIGYLLTVSKGLLLLLANPYVLALVGTIGGIYGINKLFKSIEAKHSEYDKSKGKNLQINYPRIFKDSYTRNNNGVWERDYKKMSGKKLIEEIKLENKKRDIENLKKDTFVHKIEVNVKGETVISKRNASDIAKELRNKIGENLKSSFSGIV